jgi:hypothetical protein
VTSNANVSVTSNDGLTTKIAAATVSLVSAALDDLYLVLKDPGGSFITSGVIPSDVIRIPQAPNGTSFVAYDEFVIDQVLSENRLRIVNNGNDTALSATELPHGVGRYGSGSITQGSITYQVIRKLDKPGQVTQLVGLSQSFRSRRTIMVWPDLVDVPGIVSGNQQPGFYLACAVGGMTAGLPSHQGFTFLGIAGIGRIYHSSNYFTDEQLTDLMQGGWYVFAQQTETSLPYTIHQLTTDPSTLETGEYSVVKNYDFVAISLSNSVKSFLGVYNVNEQTLSFVRTALEDKVTELRTRTYPRIGAPLLTGEVVSVIPSPLSGDRVVAVVNVGHLAKPLLCERHLRRPDRHRRRVRAAHAVPPLLHRTERRTRRGHHLRVGEPRLHQGQPLRAPLPERHGCLRLGPPHEELAFVAALHFAPARRSAFLSPTRAAFDALYAARSFSSFETYATMPRYALSNRAAPRSRRFGVSASRSWAPESSERRRLSIFVVLGSVMECPFVLGPAYPEVLQLISRRTASGRLRHTASRQSRSPPARRRPRYQPW